MAGTALEGGANVAARRLERSREAFERGQRFLPGGLARPALNFAPHAVFIDRGEGAYIYDLDGNRYLDFHNNFTAQAVGHAHPAAPDEISSVPTSSIYP